MPDDIVTKFTDWSSELGSLSEVFIPRSYFKQNFELLELHMFGDSSQDVFSAVAFLRGKIVSEHGSSTELAFVFEKARVAPMKTLTILKLEIQAALLSARLRNDIQQALTLEIEKTSMWRDSTTVLQWLHSLEKQPVFVANRVADILELTTVDEWFYVQSFDNPADAGTRSLSSTALLESCWLKGPSFLRTPEWPFKPCENIRSELKQAKLDLSGRSIALTRNSCALQTICCAFCRRVACTRLALLPSPIPRNLKMLNNISSTLFRPSPSQWKKLIC